MDLPDTYIFKSRDDAKKVINAMTAIIEEFKFVTVGDFYDLVGAPPGDWKDSKKGWTKLDTASIDQVSLGFRITLPIIEDISVKITERWKEVEK